MSKVAGTSHVDVAAYVLGALDEPDNSAFEAHLMDCSHCQLELLELHELPELLDEVKRSWPAAPVPMPGPRVLNALRAEVTRTRRRRRRPTWFAAAAAVLALIVGPLLTLAFVGSDEPTAGIPQAQPTESAEVRSGVAPNPTENARPFGGTDPVNPIAARIALQPRDWGAQVELELRGITGPLRCQLVAISRGGDTEPVTGWTVPRKGYGVAGSPEPLRVSGGTALTPGEIERFEVRAEDGTLLVTVRI